MSESIPYAEHRAMFGDAPFRFLSFLVLSFAGIGLLLLIGWYLSCRYQRLTIGDGRAVYESGLFSRDRSELQLSTIRSVRVRQTFLQRLFGVGDIFITSSGSTAEIVAFGMPRATFARGLLTSPRQDF